MEQLTLFKEMEETKNRNGYIVNERGRECVRCGEFKVWDCFHLDKSRRKHGNGRTANCKDCRNKKRREARKCLKRLALFNGVERKYKFGDVREDGMIFYSYSVLHGVKKNFESWITKEAYETFINQVKEKDKRRRAEFAKKERKFKRGDVREDGMVFHEYGSVHSANNFELWLSREEFELKCFDVCQRNAMHKSLLRGKDKTTNEIRGLNIHDFRCYIESLFEDGMNWSNRGSYTGEWDPENPKWHIDHILPLSSVDNLEDKKHLWHYTNLRPMWGNENIRKSNKHCPEQLAAFLEERRAAK